MAVAPPIDLVACSQAISRSHMFAYNRWFVRMLMQQVRTRREFVNELAQISLVPPPRTLFQFDDRITARLSGFADAHEYYRLNSSLPLMTEIRVPTVILAAADDPVVPVAVFHRAQLSPSVQVHITPGGGHVGFIGRASGDPDRNWLDWRAVEFVTSAI
jgi:predicted alpha/beta-fold hydrolase